MSEPLDLSAHIRKFLALDPSAPEIEQGGTWHSWGALAVVANGVERALTSTVEPGSPVGLIMRNDPALVGAMLGVLLARCCIVTINPSQGDAGLSRDVEALKLPIVVGVEPDWHRDGVVAAAQGAVGLNVGVAPATVDIVAGLSRLGPGPFRRGDVGIAVEMLTSGTTGKPKRVPLAYTAFERTIIAAGAHYGSRDLSTEPRLRSGVAIVSSPLVHMSGLFRTLLNVCEGRRIALMDRFRVTEFIDLVERHRPRAISLVPAALGMLLEADIDPAALSSVEVVTSGTAHLPAAVQEQFEKRYGVAVLTSYGATEFAGGVAGWNLKLHRQWASAKRGSVGRPQSGRELRIISFEDGTEVASGEQGQIEVRTAGGDWVRTTDIGRLDADGFLFVDGRSDDVIVRGGFKITPSEISAVLHSHPAVRDAGIVGMADERLGAVPVAAVELHSGAAVTESELLEYIRARVTPYQVPTRLIVVDQLPRTPSMKVSQPGLKALFEEARI